MIPMLLGNIFGNVIILIIQVYGYIWVIGGVLMEPICFKSIHWHVTLMTGPLRMSKCALFFWWNYIGISMTSQTNLFWG